MIQTEFTASLIVLSILGIFISGHLIKKRVKKQPLVCPINGNCEKVVSSKWNNIFFIKNDLLGLIYYIIILMLAIYLFFISINLLFITKIISGLALLFSLFLLIIQAKVIKKFCFYCLISAIITLFIFINLLIL